MPQWRYPVWPPELEVQDDLGPSQWIEPRLLPWGKAHGTRVGSPLSTSIQLGILEERGEPWPGRVRCIFRGPIRYRRRDYRAWVSDQRFRRTTRATR